MQLTPILMAITCAYKEKVETHVLLTKNEKWISSNFFHKFSNILMKLKRNAERKYSMQIYKVNNNKNNNKMEIQIYKRVYAGS